MFMAAKKHGRRIFPKGLVEQLKRIRKLGFKLAIVSGIRTDIMSGMLQIAKIPVEFDYIYGQPPVLGVENQEDDVKDLRKHGKICFSIGDKLSDLQRIPKAKKVFVRWGHAEGGEERYADYTIARPGELEGIIR
jgi:phosphoglycolate phosphatase-like HAD superfamily hydrolase